MLTDAEVITKARTEVGMVIVLDRATYLTLLDVLAASTKKTTWQGVTKQKCTCCDMAFGFHDNSCPVAAAIAALRKELGE